MPQPLVSIIIPVYNSAKYLAETIQSALNQTWADIELIVINNGSTDNSLSIAESFESEKIKIFSQVNKGASNARNRGLQEATGDYIQFLDSDDLLSPDKIEKQMAQLSGNVGLLSICPTIHFNNNDALIDKLPNAFESTYYYDTNEPFEFLLKLYGAENNRGGMIPIHSWLSPANLVPKAGYWDESLSINDDGEFFCRVVLASRGIVVANDTFCYYRKHTESLSLSAGRGVKALESEYKAISLINSHLNNFKHDNRIELATARGLMSLLLKTYPEYKQLSATITGRLKQLKVKPQPLPIGGWAIETIKNTLGWKAARTLQYYRQKGLFNSKK